MKSIVSEKGQVTIPKPIRDKLGLRAGTILELDAVEGKLVGVKRDTDDPFRKWLGRGKLPWSVDDYLRRIRG